MAEKFRVLVSDKMSPKVEAAFKESKVIDLDIKTGLSPEELLKVIGDYHGLAVRSATKVTAEVLAAAKKLKVIGRAGVGVDNIDVPEASRRGIVVENTPSGNSQTTAEHAMCLLMSLLRHVPQATASMKAGKWDKKKFEGTEMLGKTLGVVGLGNIGRIVASLGMGLKMQVLGFDPVMTKEAASALGIELVALSDLFERADFITVHTPLNDETRGIVGKAAFDRMKQGVFVVNAARGGIVDEAALADALESGKVAGAALDVFEKEPPDPGHPLVAHDRVICTPHLGASTGEAQENVAVQVAEQIIAYAERGEIRNAVNLSPVPAEVLPRLQPWFELCERLGSLVGQLQPKEGGIDRVEIEVTGDIGEHGAGAMTSAALAGLLSHFMEGPLNQVNASLMAKERGLKVSETKRARPEDFASFANTVTVRTVGPKGERMAMGTVFQVGDKHLPRIVQLDGFVLDLVPDGRLLLVENANKPGVIGSVGTLLGRKGINVGSLHVGRAESDDAVMLWDVDAQLSEGFLEEVRALDNVRAALQISL